MSILFRKVKTSLLQLQHLYSAVHFTKKNKIPTVYFDPTNKMIENQTAAQQFELIGSEKIISLMEKELNK